MTGEIESDQGYESTHIRLGEVVVNQVLLIIEASINPIKSIKKRFDAEGIEIPFPQSVVTLLTPEEQPGASKSTEDVADETRRD